MSLLLLCLLWFQEPVTVQNSVSELPKAWKKVPISKLIQQKQLTITTNDSNIGPSPTPWFDGEEKTLQRSENINPLRITLTFTEEVKLHSIRLLPSHADTHDWMLKLEDAGKSFKISGAASEKWSRIDLPATTKSKKFSIELKRTVGDNYVHLNELEVYADVPEAWLTRPKANWPKPLPAPTSGSKAVGPWNDPADTTVWPNQSSNANSDVWLAQNHDNIKRMNPRLLLINFSNQHNKAHLDLQTRQLITALAESSKYHGYKNANAAPFLNYQVFKFIDLRDGTTGDSAKAPVKRNSNGKARPGINFDYGQLFSQEFANHYGVVDPRDSKRFLRLDELVDAGYVHEVWFFVSGDVKGEARALESVEEKPRYNDKFEKIEDRFVQAGNGGDNDQPWTGRSVRLGCVNSSRGIGCFLESLGHSMEGTASSGAIPYFTKYFTEYAGFDLNTRYNVPFKSFYDVGYDGKNIRYPDSKTAIITHKGKEYKLENYTAIGGNAHFPPNARNHYDLDNIQPVQSIIETWRIPGDKTKMPPKAWTNSSFRNYRDIAPDCMGAWLIYWRQNMPGLGNLQKDDEGKPMKNWMPFLFY